MSTAPVSPTFLRIVLQGTGLPHAALGVSDDELDAPLAYERAVAIWEAIAGALDDPLAGHRLGSGLRLHQVGVFGPLFAHASDFGSALSVVAQATAIALPGADLRVEEGPEGWSAFYRRPASVAQTRHGVEALFAAAVGLAQQVCERRDLVAALTLETDPPVDREPFDLHYGVPVEFGADFSSVRFHRDALTVPLRSRDEAMARLVVTHAEQLLRRETFSGRVREACGEAIDAGVPRASWVATHLGVGVRTLHRRLRAEGTSFRPVFESVASERARSLLGDESRSVEAIGERLGYASRSAFDRAFRRWFGVTPAVYRRDTSR